MDAHRLAGGYEEVSGSDEAAGIVDASLAHLDTAYNLARWLTGSDHDAEDMVQEAYLRALRAAGTYRGRSARSWILTIVRNACFDRLRRQKIAPFDDSEGDAPPDVSAVESDPAVILERAEDVARTRQSIAQLAPNLREAVVLRDLEGMSYKEIAAISGVPMGTVMSRLARGRTQLVAMLSEDRTRSQGVKP